MNSITVEEAVMLSFNLFMMIECNACCIFRELFGLSVKDMAVLLQTCKSLIHKLEYGGLADGHDLKEDYMRYLRLGIIFITKINSEALEYYILHRNKLIEDRTILKLSEDMSLHGDKKLVTKCKICRNNAMRISVLITIAKYYNLEIDYWIEQLYTPKHRYSEKEYMAAYNAFESSVLKSKEEPFALNKAQQMMIWQILKDYSECLKTIKKRPIKC